MIYFFRPSPLNYGPLDGYGPTKRVPHPSLSMGESLSCTVASYLHSQSLQNFMPIIRFH